MNLKLIVIAIIILVIVLGAWYLYYSFTVKLSPSPVTDTTTDISNDLNQIPDDTSLNNEMDSLNQELQDF